MISTPFKVTSTIDVTPPQITELAHSPTDPQPTDTVTIMADITDAESNINSATLYYSTDGGSSWSPLRDGLTSMHVYSLATNAHGDMFAGTSNGVFRIVQEREPPIPIVQIRPTEYRTIFRLTGGILWPKREERNTE